LRPAINACIAATNSCEFSDGVYTIGSSSMTAFDQSTISFGWTPAQQNGVKLTGTGKTVLRLADNMNASPNPMRPTDWSTASCKRLDRAATGR